MSNDQSTKKNNVLPFEVTTGFTAIPNAVCTHYVRHPRFNANAERLYRYLLQRHNDAFGYAWPSYSDIRRATGMSSNGTISKALDALEYLELIKRHEHRSDNGWTNNYYTFFTPIEDKAEFERKFSGELRKE